MLPQYIIFVKSELDKKYDIILNKKGYPYLFDTYKQAKAFVDRIGMRSGYHIGVR